MKRLLVCLVFFTFWLGSASAQFKTAYIGVNGLTCSQCSRTVELQLRKLSFVKKVDMNLRHTEGVITLKSGEKTDISQIAQAVVNAGFSLRYLHADLDVSTLHISGKCFSYNGDSYALSAPLHGNDVIKLHFLGRPFMSKSEVKKITIPANATCNTPGGKTYFVEQLR